MPYRGSEVANQRVDRPDEGLATEHAGPGGTGTARATLDSGRPKARTKGAKSVLHTDRDTLPTTQRAIDSA